MENKAINKKVVITGGPGTGKTSVIKELMDRGYKCYDEGSRGIISQINLKGKTFKSDPLSFSDSLYKARTEHYFDSQKEEYKGKTVFFDRGIHDILAYLRYINENNKYWENIILNYKYDTVFVFPPWKEIYTTDKERHEDFKESEEVNFAIIKLYKESNSDIVEIPKIGIEERVNFIINHLFGNGK